MPRRILRPKAYEGTVWDEAVRRAEQALGMADQYAVSFSGGKDSTATLHVVIEAARRAGRLPVPAFFYDEEAIPPDTADYVRRLFHQNEDVDLRWLCVPTPANNACSKTEPVWYPWDPDLEHLWCRAFPAEADDYRGLGWPEEREAWPHHYNGNQYVFDPQGGKPVVFLGIRAQESLMRSRSVLDRTEDNWLIPDVHLPGLDKAYPIYDWQIEDVWRAPHVFGWDYNRAYDLMEMAGLPPGAARCSPPYGAEPMQRLYTYKVCWPELWAKMVNRVPGAATAARYATTGLYAYASKPELPRGVTSWPAYLVAELEDFPPRERRREAQRIRRLVGRHYDKTNDPILVHAKHPDTGISWSFLYVIARRGDPMNRRQESATPKAGPERDRAIAAYQAELLTFRGAGREEEIGWHGRPL